MAAERSTRAKRIAAGLRRQVFGTYEKPVVDRDPPKVPAGWRTGPPDFVGVGVQRAGTTWWFQELRKHPQLSVARGTRKELHFFDAFANRALTDSEIARYHRWFPRSDHGIAGEWTPVYAYEPWVIPMIQRAAPDARILLLLRDPVDRFWSGVEFGLRRGYTYNRSVVEAFHRGLYAGQVARVFDHIRRERVLVLLYEELRADPAGERRRTAAFVGLDPDRFPNAIEAGAPTSRTSDPHGMSRALLEEVRARYRDDLEQLRTLLPEADFEKWSSLHAS